MSGEARQRLGLHEDRPEQQALGFGAVALAHMRVPLSGEPEIDCLSVVVRAAAILDESAVHAVLAVLLGRQREQYAWHDRGDGAAYGELWPRQDAFGRVGLRAGGQLQSGDVPVVRQPRDDAAHAYVAQTRHASVPAAADCVDRLDQLADRGEADVGET